MMLGCARMSFSPKIPDYDLIKLIGEGGFGQIWMGKDALGLYRAIKIIRYDDSKSLESYQAEHNGIRHYAPYSRKYDGLIDIHHVGIREEEGFYYYVMDLADDLYLDDHVAAAPRDGCPPALDRGDVGHLQARACGAGAVARWP